MRMLVLGGTAWLGAALARTAVAVGDEVTCLARGASGDVPDGVAWVRADRDAPGAYDALTGEWDLVLDVARQPGQVRSAVAALADRAAHWVFVSSGNVYADHRQVGTDEEAPLLPALEGDVMTSMDVYGEAKVACEQHVLQGCGERALLARVGLIGGPGDSFDRSGYWPWRFAHPAADDGAVLVPDAPAHATQMIDVRDLATWLLAAGREASPARSTSPVRRCRSVSTWRWPEASRATTVRSSPSTSGGCSSTACRPGWASARCRCGSTTPTGPASTPATAAWPARPA